MQGFANATGRRSKRPRISDFADMVAWPEGDYEQYRPFGPVFSECLIWFSIVTERHPNGVPVPMPCLDHDGYTDTMVTEKCPFRSHPLGREARNYFVNVIDRNLQADREYRPLDLPIEEHLGFKAKWVKAGDSRRTPVRLLMIPDSKIDVVQKMSSLNKVHGEAVDITDLRAGCNVGLLFDKNKKGPAKYDIQKGDRTPITREERAYGMYRADLCPRMRLEEAKREMDELAPKVVDQRRKDKDEKSVAGGNQRRVPDDPLMENSSVRLGEEDLDLEQDRGGNRRRDNRSDPDAAFNERAPSRGRREPPDAYAALDDAFEDDDRGRSRRDEAPRGRREDPQLRRRPSEEPRRERYAQAEEPRRRPPDDSRGRRQDPQPRRRAPEAFDEDLPF